MHNRPLKVPKIPRTAVILAGLAILITFSIELYNIVGDVDQALFDAQWGEKVRTVNLFCDEVDRYVREDDDWGVFDYASLMRDQAQDLDAWPSLFAALFDDELNLLSRRISVTGEPLLHPLTDTTILEMIRLNELGEITTTYNGVDSLGEQIRVYFRWIPSGKTYEHRLLFMIAMRVVALTATPGTRLVKWCALLIAVTGMLNLFTGILFAAKPHGGDDG